MSGRRIARHDRLLIVHLGGPHRVLSWAVLRGGLVEADAVAWLQVTDDELRPPVDPRRFLEDHLTRATLRSAVGLMTSAALESYTEAARACDGVEVSCVATVGLDNALRAGDPVAASGDRVHRAGTINVLCQLPFAVSDEALAETLALAAEARTLAVLEEGVRSRQGGRPATGTGTDCIAVAAPCGVARARYAGKHTVLGHLVGAVVEQAVREGVRRWRERKAMLSRDDDAAGR